MKAVKAKVLLGIFAAMAVGVAHAQDEAQRNMREQERQRNNWYWHQAEQDAVSTQQQLEAPLPQPTGEWIKTWGAVANGSNGEGGISKGKFSKRDAVTAAVYQCQRGGGVDCKPTSAYYNQCIALTANSRAGAGSIARASKLAVDLCKKNGVGQCEIVYSDCTEPYFRKYN